MPLLLALVVLAVLAPAASADVVGNDLAELESTRAISCQGVEECALAQCLCGNGSPFAPSSGILTSWSVKLGAEAPEGIRLLLLEADGTGGEGQPRRTIGVGSLHKSPHPGSVTEFQERLPIQADQSFGVRIEGSSPAGTRASILAPYRGEYSTVLLWGSPLPFGGPKLLADRTLTHLALSIEAQVSQPSPERCDPFNTYTGSSRGDDYGGFADGGDLIYGRGGPDQLRGYQLEDCIYGGGGNDGVLGMDGSDLLSGGSGSDEVGAGQGNDRILVRDGAADTVRCGSGTDFVKADRLDRLSSCERVRRG